MVICSCAESRHPPSIHWCWSNRTCSPPLAPSWFKQYLSRILFTGFHYSSICWWQRCSRGDTPQWQGQPPLHPLHHHPLTQPWCPREHCTPCQSIHLRWPHTHTHTQHHRQPGSVEGKDRTDRESKWKKVMDGGSVSVVSEQQPQQGQLSLSAVVSDSDGAVDVMGSWWPKWPGKQGVAHTAVVTVVISHSVINAHNQRCLHACVCVNTHAGVCLLITTKQWVTIWQQRALGNFPSCLIRNSGWPRASPHQLTLGPG